MRQLTVFLVCFIGVLATISFAACNSSYSGNRKPKTVDVSSVQGYRDVPFRAHRTWFSSITYKTMVDNTVQIVYADSAFREGDTVSIGTNEYILQERVK